jgi:stage III sporulation protein SpoIIIAA
MELKEKIIKIKSLLSVEQANQDIVEIENNYTNQNIIEFLESIGAEEVKYEIESNSKLGYIQEKGGVTYLWYKKSDGHWIIKLWEINRLLN